MDGVEVVDAEETAGGLLVVGVRLVGRPRCGWCGGNAGGGVLMRGAGWGRLRSRTRG